MAKKRPKTSNTRITFEEKIDIQKMVADNKTPKEIGTELKRSPAAIQRYINEFKQLITRIDTSGTPDQDMPKNEFVNLEMYNDALKKMRLNGLANETARARLNSVIAKLTASPSSAQNLANAAITRMTPQEMMVTKSAGGQKGVAVMTEAASYRGDIAKPKAKAKTHNCLYNAKTGEPL